MPIGIPKAGKRNYKLRVPRVTFKCARCEKEITRPVVKLGRFCSRSCSHAALQRIDIPKCLYCGKQVSRRNANRAKHCSVECSAAAKRIPGAKWRSASKIAEYQKLYRAKNLDRLRPLARARCVLRRARKKNAPGSFTHQQWLCLCDQFNNKCIRCLRDDLPLTRDHVVPLSRGGTNFISNIQPLCHSCNLAKGVSDIDLRGSFLARVSGKGVDVQLWTDKR